MEKQRTILAITISIIVIVGWNMLFPPKQPEKELPPPEAIATGQDTASVSKSPAPAVDPLPLLPEEELDTAVAQDIVIETNQFRAVIDTRGAYLKSLLLKNHLHFKSSISLAQWLPFLKPILGDVVSQKQTEDNLVQMIKSDFQETAPTLGVDFPNNSDFTRLFQRAVFSSDADSITLINEGEQQRLVLTSPIRSGLQVVKTLTFHANTFVIDYRVNLINRGVSSKSLDVRYFFGEGPLTEKSVGQTQNHEGPVYSFEESIDTVDSEDILVESSRVKQMDWLGIESSYYIVAATGLSPVREGFFEATNMIVGQDALAVPRFGIGLPPVDLQPGKQIESDFRLYYGPKSEEEMRKFGNNLYLSKDLMLQVLVDPLLAILFWIHDYVGNYGVAIILLTVLVRLALFPLTYKGSKSMKRMQQLQPKMTKLREKYKNNKEKLNAEMMGLYRKNKINPVGGCLPLFLQMPVFFALYSALSSAVELRHSPFFFWIQDLSAPDGLGILPILMGISMYFVQKMTPNAMMDSAQAKIMMMLPIIFTFFSFTFPTGLTLYWVTSNILSIAQQYFINQIKLPEIQD